MTICNCFLFFLIAKKLEKKTQANVLKINNFYCFQINNTKMNLFLFEEDVSEKEEEYGPAVQQHCDIAAKDQVDLERMEVEEGMTAKPQIEDEVELEPELDNTLQLEGEEKKSVKKNYEKIVKMEEEIVAQIKKSLDKKKITSDDELATFSKNLDKLIYLYKGPREGLYFVCLVCLMRFRSRQKARSHVDGNHVENTKHHCRKCVLWYLTSSSLKRHVTRFHKRG